jgi:hypothetical protein
MCPLRSTAVGRHDDGPLIHCVPTTRTQMEMMSCAEISVDVPISLDAEASWHAGGASWLLGPGFGDG